MRLSTIVAASVAACFGVFISAPAAHAGSVVNGGMLMTQAYADQLAGWLGEGDLVLTNIFSSTPGDGKNSYGFHGAADGQGRTIVLFKVNAGNYTSLDYANGNQYYSAFVQEQIVGGYNPQSWASTGDHHTTNDDSDRTAFIFNLSTSVIQHQRLQGDPHGDSWGSSQTYNRGDFGPSFGNGDLGSGDLYSAFMRQTSYGEAPENFPYGGINILGLPGSTGVSLGALEVYTIANAPSAVPTPAAAAGGLVLLGGMRLLRRRNPVA
jgi:hypothetical protein